MSADRLAALNAERYGPSLWWQATPTETEAPDDSEATCARRRRRLADEYARVRGAA